jgi:hypothetical protein
MLIFPLNQFETKQLILSTPASFNTHLVFSVNLRIIAIYVYGELFVNIIRIRRYVLP